MTKSTKLLAAFTLRLLERLDFLWLKEAEDDNSFLSSKEEVLMVILDLSIIS